MQVSEAVSSSKGFDEDIVLKDYNVVKRKFFLAKIDNCSWYFGFATAVIMYLLI